MCYKHGQYNCERTAYRIPFRIACRSTRGFPSPRSPKGAERDHQSLPLAASKLAGRITPYDLALNSYNSERRPPPCLRQGKPVNKYKGAPQPPNLEFTRPGQSDSQKLHLGKRKDLTILVGAPHTVTRGGDPGC